MKRLPVFAFVLGGAFLTPALAGQDEPLFQVTGTDVSARYEFLLNEPELSEKAMGKLRPLRILFVPGYFSDVVLGAGEVPGMAVLRIGEYFDDQMDWLAGDQGFPHIERAAIESEDDIGRNARRLADIIHASGQDVILVTHSKGGLDSLEALIRHPELRPRIRGWVALQSPWHGSPVADMVGESPVLGKGAREFLQRIMKGRGESLGNLTMSERKDYHDRFRDEIRRIVRSVPIISVATYKEGILEGPVACSAFEPLRLAMKGRLKLDSDGMVPWESAVLEGTDYVVIPGADHLDTVMPLPCNVRFNRNKMTAALLAMLSDRIGP